MIAVSRRSAMILVAISLAVPAVWWVASTEAARGDYATECAAGTPSTHPNATLSSESWTQAVTTIKEQGEYLTNIGLLAFGGAVALITTTRVHRFAGIRWLFLLLAPVLSFLAGSLWAGNLFQRRLAYLGLNECRDTAALMALSYDQYRFLTYAIWLMAIFGVVCLLQIVAGDVDPTEKS